MIHFYIKCDDFKASIEKFSDRIQIVKKELSIGVKDNQVQVAGLFEAVILQRARFFELDNKSSLGFHSRASVTNTVLRDGSIALNPSAQKQ